MKFERIAALGALGVVGGVIVTYAALAWFGSSTEFAGVPGATGGIDHTNRNVIWIAAAVPVAIFVWSHLVFARQLRRGPSSLND